MVNRFFLCLLIILPCKSNAQDDNAQQLNVQSYLLPTNIPSQNSTETQIVPFLDCVAPPPNGNCFAPPSLITAFNPIPLIVAHSVLSSRNPFEATVKQCRFFSLFPFIQYIPEQVTQLVPEVFSWASAIKITPEQAVICFMIGYHKEIWSAGKNAFYLTKMGFNNLRSFVTRSKPVQVSNDDDSSSQSGNDHQGEEEIGQQLAQENVILQGDQKEEIGSPSVLLSQEIITIQSNQAEPKKEQLSRQSISSKRSQSSPKKAGQPQEGWFARLKAKCFSLCQRSGVSISPEKVRQQSSTKKPLISNLSSTKKPLGSNLSSIKKSVQSSDPSDSEGTFSQKSSVSKNLEPRGTD